MGRQKDYLEQALALHRQLGNPLGEASTWATWGWWRVDQGDYTAAQDYHEQALALHRQLGNPLGEATALGNLGLVALDQGDYAAANDYFEQALDIDRSWATPGARPRPGQLGAGGAKPRRLRGGQGLP